MENRDNLQFLCFAESSKHDKNHVFLAILQVLGKPASLPVDKA